MGKAANFSMRISNTTNYSAKWIDSERGQKARVVRARALPAEGRLGNPGPRQRQIRSRFLEPSVFLTEMSVCRDRKPPSFASKFWPFARFDDAHATMTTGFQSFRPPSPEDRPWGVALPPKPAAHSGHFHLWFLDFAEGSCAKNWNWRANKVARSGMPLALRKDLQKSDQRCCTWNHRRERQDGSTANQETGLNRGPKYSCSSSIRWTLVQFKIKPK